MGRFNPTKQKLHVFLDVLQKTAREAFGPEARKLIDKTIFAKTPDHDKKILNQTNPEDKANNDIILYLEREMRLNGLGTLDEITLIPLNSVNAAAPEEKKEQQHGGYCFHCSRYGHCKAQSRRLKKERYYEEKTKTANTNQSDAHKQKCETCGKMHKTENCCDGANAAKDPRRKRRDFTIPTKTTSEQPLPAPPAQPKTKIAAPTFRGKIRREGEHHRRTPTLL